MIYQWEIYQTATHLYDLLAHMISQEIAFIEIKLDWLSDKCRKGDKTPPWRSQEANFNLLVFPKLKECVPFLY